MDCPKCSCQMVLIGSHPVTWGCSVCKLQVVDGRAVCRLTFPGHPTILGLMPVAVAA